MYTLANWGSSFNPKGLVGSGKMQRLGIISQMSLRRNKKAIQEWSKCDLLGIGYQHEQFMMILGKAVPPQQTQTWMYRPSLSLLFLFAFQIPEKWTAKDGSLVSHQVDREAKLDPGGRLRVGLSSTMVAIVAIVAMAVANWWCPIANGLRKLALQTLSRNCCRNRVD